MHLNTTREQTDNQDSGYHPKSSSQVSPPGIILRLIKFITEHLQHCKIQSNIDVMIKSLTEEITAQQIHHLIKHRYITKLRILVIHTYNFDIMASNKS
jgi:hypothetical protein